jgi:hypothetical protein
MKTPVSNGRGFSLGGFAHQYRAHPAPRRDGMTSIQTLTAVTVTVIPLPTRTGQTRNGPE